MEKTVCLDKYDIEKRERINWIKVAVVGSSLSGKTCLVKYFCERILVDDSTPTVGVDYGFKILDTGDKKIHSTIWDFSGATEFFDVRNELYENTDVSVIVFDSSCYESFLGLPVWLKEVRKYSNLKTHVAIIANKVDKVDDTILNEAVDWCKEHKLTMYKTNCKTGQGIMETFVEILEKTHCKR